MKKRESEHFSATLPLLDFYGWTGNSITISTALVNDMRGEIFTPALHSAARKAGLCSPYTYIIR